MISGYEISLFVHRYRFSSFGLRNALFTVHTVLTHTCVFTNSCSQSPGPRGGLLQRAHPRGGRLDSEVGRSARSGQAGLSTGLGAPQVCKTRERGGAFCPLGVLRR